MNDGPPSFAAGGELAERKAGATLAACIPARNEASTIRAIVSTCAELVAGGVLDELIVIDDGSTDGTGDAARAAGARVLRATGKPGKGQALALAVEVSRSNILIFLDADVTNFDHRFITSLAAPLFERPAFQMVKASYRRPLDGRSDEGGRVTELLARPLLDRFFPSVATIAQPLAGECAIRRTCLEKLDLAPGYGIEIGLLIDVAILFGRDAIHEVDLGERIHRNRPLRDLAPHSRDVLDVVLSRAGVGDKRSVERGSPNVSPKPRTVGS